MLLFLCHQAYVAITIHPDTRGLWVVGYLVHKELTDGEVYLEAYAAHPQYQRRKVGAALLRTFFNAIKGCSTVSAMVDKRNTASRNLLEAMSFMWGREWQVKPDEGRYWTYWMVEGKAKAKK
jgi:ribosomal protein S18 acetylase RimI-like enzyme